MFDSTLIDTCWTISCCWTSLTNTHSNGEHNRTNLIVWIASSPCNTNGDNNNNLVPYPQFAQGWIPAEKRQSIDRRRKWVRKHQIATVSVQNPPRPHRASSSSDSVHLFSSLDITDRWPWAWRPSSFCCCPIHSSLFLDAIRVKGSLVL